MPIMTIAQALNDALRLEMERDPNIYIAGEDVGVYGGIFGVTKGLLDHFGPRRIRDTPITESAIIGSAVGAAVAGLRPVVELMLVDFIGVAMDQLRYYLGLLAKHLDVQIAILVAPEFNNGLSGSLVGNPNRRVNMGLKGLQISGNSIMPLLTFFGNSLVDRFPTHAEQFNQNINSQGFGSANLARQSIAAFQQYIAGALMFGVQAVDLRSRLVAGHYDARRCLSPATLPLYEALREIVRRPPSADRPYIRNDNEQSLSDHIQRIAADIAACGRIPAAVPGLRHLNR